MQMEDTGRPVNRLDLHILMERSEITVNDRSPLFRICARELTSLRVERIDSLNGSISVSVTHPKIFFVEISKV